MGSLSKRKRDQTEEVVTDDKPAATEVEKPTKPSQKQEDETSFVDLGLDPRLLQAIAQQKFAKPTLVQRKAIPLALNGQDVLAKADCGSGKTAAYVLPLLSSILKRKAVCHPDSRDILFLKALLITMGLDRLCCFHNCPHPRPHPRACRPGLQGHRTICFLLRKGYQHSQVDRQGFQCCAARPSFKLARHRYLNPRDCLAQCQLFSTLNRQTHTSYPGRSRSCSFLRLQ